MHHQLGRPNMKSTRRFTQNSMSIGPQGDYPVDTSPVQASISLYLSRHVGLKQNSRIRDVYFSVIGVVISMKTE